MTRDELFEMLEEYECPIATGFDAAIIGLGCQFNTTFAVYDRAKVIEILVAQGLTEEDAEEHFAFNIGGAYVGESTPAFVDLVERAA